MIFIFEYPLSFVVLDGPQALIEFVVPFKNVVVMDRIDLILIFLQEQLPYFLERCFTHSWNLICHVEGIAFEDEKATGVETDHHPSFAWCSYDASDFCLFLDAGGKDMFVFLPPGFQRQGDPCYLFFLSQVKSYNIAFIGPHHYVQPRNSLNTIDALILRQNSIYFDLFTLNFAVVKILQFLKLH